MSEPRKREIVQSIRRAIYHLGLPGRYDRLLQEAELMSHEALDQLLRLMVAASEDLDRARRDVKTRVPVGDQNQASSSLLG